LPNWGNNQLPMRAPISDADVRDEAVAGAFDDLAGKPSRNQADQ